MATFYCIRIFKLSGRFRLLLCAFACLLSGCGEALGIKEIRLSGGYDLHRPYMLKLATELDEISGLAYVQKDSSLLAIVDERGYVYKIRPKQPSLTERWKYYDNGDYEDLVIVGDSIYVLRSDGALLQVTIASKDSTITTIYQYPERGNEFEAMYYERDSNRIVLMCKDCDADKKKYLSTFQFDLATKQFSTTGVHIDAKAIAKALGEEKIKFKPSAADIHPLTGRLWIVSAVNDVLVVARRDGTVEQVFRLKSGLYKQPEGLTFSPWGTMYMSNEMADEGVANVLIFPLQKTDSTK